MLFRNGWCYNSFMNINDFFKIAVDKKASDLHLAAGKPPILRIDGHLAPISKAEELGRADLEKVVFSILTPNQKEKFLEERDIDLSYETSDGSRFRVNILCEKNNLALVARVINSQVPSMEDIGMPEVVYQMIRARQGLILVTGPTGCGKSTSLAAMLNLINQERVVNIVTMEDPIEFIFNSEKSIIMQRQLGTDMNSFQSALKHVLRQDPDIVMVGEIRDRETVNIAIEASLTGHLVLSTIHTNSAVETLTRILNMGVPPFLMTATINTIISQRLVRKLCQNCKQQIEIDPNTLTMVNEALATISAGAVQDVPPERIFYGPRGCEQCGDIGYKGRVGVYELMTMTNGLKRMVIAGANTLDMQKVAMQEGMLTLEQSGIIKALLGLTSLEEVYRVARHVQLEPEPSGGSNARVADNGEPQMPTANG